MYNLISVNKRNSFILIFIMGGLIVAVGYIFGAYYGSGEIGLIFALVLAFILTLTSLFGGKSIVLAISGAKIAERNDYPQLYNIVEELTIASGLPMPKIYVILDSAPNAFATGRNPKNSAVAVTTGLLAKLNRSELQGVIAHELSHIKNYDILFATLMGVLAGVIVLLCDGFWRIGMRRMFYGRRRSRSSRSKGGGIEIILFLIALLLAILAPIFAKIIQLAVSRQREYLADASGAMMTRYPEGLASALEKIANDKEVLEVANRATQHLYIVNPIKPFEKRAKSLFSTHPPIEERVRRLRELTIKPLT